MISKIILQCSRKKLDYNYIKNIKSHFSDEFIYYNFIDAECIEYFIKNPLIGFENIIEKYNSFKSGAHKADLFRYYFLYINGGVFLDDDVMIYHNLDHIIYHYDMFFVNSKSHQESIFNGVIGCDKNNLIIYQALVDTYNIDNILLIKNYFLICENLFKIVKNNKNSHYNIKFFEEQRVYPFKRFGYDKVTDKNMVYFRHFWGKKIIFKTNGIVENSLFIKVASIFYKLYSILKFFKKIIFGIVKYYLTWMRKYY